MGLNVGQSSRNFMTIVFRARQWGREPFLLTERYCADIGVASSGKFLTVVFSHDIHRAGDSDKRFLSRTRGLTIKVFGPRQADKIIASYVASRWPSCSSLPACIWSAKSCNSGNTSAIWEIDGIYPIFDYLIHKISPALHRYSFFRSINVPPRPHHSKSIKSQSESIRVNPSQSESIRVNPSQSESIRVNPSQSESIRVNPLRGPRVAGAPNATNEGIDGQRIDDGDGHGGTI
jgi:hypothetical protein